MLWLLGAPRVLSLFTQPSAHGYASAMLAVRHWSLQPSWHGIFCMNNYNAQVKFCYGSIVSWVWQWMALLSAFKREAGGSLHSTFGSSLICTEVTRPFPGFQSETVSQKGQIRETKICMVFVCRNTSLVSISSTEADILNCFLLFLSHLVRFY